MLTLVTQSFTCGTSLDSLSPFLSHDLCSASRLRSEMSDLSRSRWLFTNFAALTLKLRSYLFNKQLKKRVLLTAINTRSVEYLIRSRRCILSTGIMNLSFGTAKPPSLAFAWKYAHTVSTGSLSHFLV